MAHNFLRCLDKQTEAMVWAQGMGLVNEVYSTVELAKAKGFEFAARLASFPVTGVRNTLSLMRPPIDELQPGCFLIPESGWSGGKRRKIFEIGK